MENEATSAIEAIGSKQEVHGGEEEQKERERWRPVERCRVSSVRWRQRAKPQAKAGDSKKRTYTPSRNGEW